MYFDKLFCFGIIQFAYNIVCIYTVGKENVWGADWKILFSFVHVFFGQI